MFERRQYQVTVNKQEVHSFDDMRSDFKDLYEGLQVGESRVCYATVACNVTRLPDLDGATLVPFSKLSQTEQGLARASYQTVHEEGKTFVHLSWLEEVRHILAQVW